MDIEKGKFMYESRVKNPETIIRKIAMHRLKGKKNYDLKGVNDLLGCRFIYKTSQQKQKLLQGLHNLARMGIFKIVKEQEVKKDTYHAIHLDIIYKGIRTEIQIHDPQSYLESIVNHEIRAQAGEKPQGQLGQEKKLNWKAAQNMPDDHAILLGKAIEQKRMLQRKVAQ